MIDSYQFFIQGIGCTKITKARNEGSINGNSESRSYLEKKLVFCFGSYVASQMLLPFGEENLLSSSEIQQAQEVGYVFYLTQLKYFLVFHVIISLKMIIFLIKNSWRRKLLSVFYLLQIATRMVVQYGWGPDDSPAIYYRTRAVYTFIICIPTVIGWLDGFLYAYRLAFKS